ncbi:rhodanese-like domain-containing protein [Marinomonas algarum]|uniref:Sulfurtransferase n=1 Tax=Marinomonas algarum TaxID=2883105 RepID=A0A9X1LDU8_9GAMM|nr:rhodanese-like domain-containing protein [Marinomonas algarum]MCB5160408.1 sulfurtransferase [Marinomonas algarum]
MDKLLQKMFLIAALALPVCSVYAEKIGISTLETQSLIQSRDDVLFVDVRDPVEIMFIGFTDAVDVNIPYLMVDRSNWDESKQRFFLYRNPNFVKDIQAALAKKGLDENATIITMCRSGSERGLPSAEFLQQNGFKNARYVVHGFQGDRIKEGKEAGFRTKNGWQNDGLPWGSKPNTDKIYRVDN